MVNIKASKKSESFDSRNTQNQFQSGMASSQQMANQRTQISEPRQSVRQKMTTRKSRQSNQYQFVDQGSSQSQSDQDRSVQTQVRVAEKAPASRKVSKTNQALHYDLKNWEPRQIDKAVIEHILAEFSGIKGAPRKVCLGTQLLIEPLGKNGIKVYFDHLSLEDGNFTLKIKPSKILDYIHQKKESRRMHLFEPKARYVFLPKIYATLEQAVHAESPLNISFQIEGLSVLHQPNFSKYPLVNEALKKIKDTFGSNLVQEKNKRFALLVPDIDEQLEDSGIPLKSLAHDWRRIQATRLYWTAKDASNALKLPTNFNHQNESSAGLSMPFGFRMADTDFLYRCIFDESADVVSIQVFPYDPAKFQDMSLVEQKHSNEKKRYHEGPIESDLELDPSKISVTARQLTYQTDAEAFQAKPLTGGGSQRKSVRCRNQVENSRTQSVQEIESDFDVGGPKTQGKPYSKENSSEKKMKFKLPQPRVQAGRNDQKQNESITLVASKDGEIQSNKQRQSATSTRNLLARDKVYQSETDEKTDQKFKKKDQTIQLKSHRQSIRSKVATCQDQQQDSVSENSNCEQAPKVRQREQTSENEKDVIRRSRTRRRRSECSDTSSLNQKVIENSSQSDNANPVQSATAPVKNRYSQRRARTRETAISRIPHTRANNETISEQMEEDEDSQIQKQNRGNRQKDAIIMSDSEREQQDQEFVSDEDFDDDQTLTQGIRNIKKIKVEPKNAYDVACQKLQLSAIPDELPCRDKERNQVMDYITQGLKNKGSSSSLYISGMPGTGKTATTLEVINALKTKKSKFSFLHINAMSLTNPNLVYTIIYEHITGRRSPPATAALFLDEFFKKRDKVAVLKAERRIGHQKRKNDRQELNNIAFKMRVILIDELDALVTKKQTLLYNLFDWPCHQNSRLLVISIANTMDLPERLQAKIASRIGNNRLVYEPYNMLQIKEILESRLKEVHKLFDKESMVFVARKVSLYSGDIRRSLQLTKRAVEICRDKHIKEFGECDVDLTKVTYKNVMDAFDELFNSKTVQVLRTLQKMEVVVVLALHHELAHRKQERVSLDDVQDRCNAILKNTLKWQNKMQTSTYREIVKRLQAFGLLALQVEPQKFHDNLSLQLSVFNDELSSAFSDKEFVVQVSKMYEPLRLLLETSQSAGVFD